MSTDGPAKARNQLSIPTEAESRACRWAIGSFRRWGATASGWPIGCSAASRTPRTWPRRRCCALTRHNDPIDEPAAWMTTVATRLSINVLKSARVRLTIRGVTRTVTGSGHYASPRPASFGEVAGLQLRTSFDRREFGFEWQMELPGGGDAVGWEVEVDIDLLLIRADTA
jgi:hypothetical protein